MREEKTRDDRISVLLTGATGYVGGRLLSRLKDSGVRLRCLARRPDYLRSRVDETVDVVEGDALELDTLERAMRGVDVAYYMIHSMGSTGSFIEQDRLAARNFASAAKSSGVRRIIYLGGLGREDAQLSSHLESRHEVGEILRASGLEVIEFRASVVIGSGSLSYEMVRSLVEGLPVMITPNWVRTAAQPIGIEDLLDYLTRALHLSMPEGGARVYEIGGADRVSYEDMMRTYADLRELPRWMVPVPVITPWLSSLWLGLVTPIYARIGRKIIDSAAYPTVADDAAARRDFGVEPIGIREAMGAALRNEDRKFAETRWSDAVSAAGVESRYGGVRIGSRLVDSRTRQVAARPEEAFTPIRRIGGASGWYAYNLLWKFRGALDRVLGGVGLGRGRADPELLRVGDALDWWRVEEYVPNNLLRLRAEMKIPGRAWLELEVRECAGGSEIAQHAVFEPSGFLGLLYWYGIYPLHALVFRGLINQLGQRALSVHRSAIGDQQQPARDVPN
ncbi:MAG: SDR family oxidoreductase [Myxococcales bacterium]|nr:SDR family oxidoreductase [Myxococcales bacterium]